MNIISTIIIGLLSFSILSSSSSLYAQRDADRLPTELILQLDPGQKPSMESGLYEELSSTLNVYRIKFSRADEAMKYYNAHIYKENVRALHYNYSISFRDTVPNDPDFDLQYALQNALSPDIDVQATDAWNFSRGGVTARGDTIVIAVVDDGVAIDHIDLQDNIFSFPNEIAGTGLDNDGNGFVDDVNGYNVRDENGEIIPATHGTGVAGIIGARGNNGILISGVNWYTKILPVTMGTDATVAEVIKAYEYVLQQRLLYNDTDGDEGAYVVALNNSFGLEGFTYNSAPYWCDFFDTLGTAGIMTVAAAPNRIFDVDEIGDLPTVCPSPYLITVASSNFANEWDVSGISTEHVDLTSYGGNILTLGLNNSTSFSQNSTSSASAMVSGLLGLLYASPCSSFIDSLQENFSQIDEVILPILSEGLIDKPFLENKTRTGGITNFYETLRPVAQTCDTCIAPVDVFIDYINPDEDTLLIAPTLLSDSVIWLQRLAGNTSWDTVNPIVLDSFYLSMGPGCDLLEFAFIPVCDSTLGTRSQVYSLSEFKECLACEIRYCTPSPYTKKDAWIEQISFRDDFSYSSNDLGYGNYSGNVFTTYETAEEQVLEIQYKKLNPSDTMAFSAWLDIDHSGTFDPLERIGTLVTSDPNTDVMTLDIPFTALGGLTTLRLGMISNSNEVDRIMPCEATPLEAYYEDHCINLIVNDPECAPIDSVELLEQSPNRIVVKYFPEMTPMDEGINVRYRVEGEEDWTRMTHQGASFAMEDLEGPCVTYELEIRRLCEFDTSAYTTFLVETSCPTSVSDIGGNNEWKVYPNPFSQNLFVKGNSSYSGTCNLRLFDHRGVLVWEKKNVRVTETFRMNLPAELRQGLYYLQLIDQDGEYHRKMLKVAN